VIFDLSLQCCITSFLRAAPRPHDVTSHGPSAVKTSIDRLSRLVFLSCLRMSTCKESIEHFITPAVFGDIIYENFVFDIPRLFDICAVYGPTNRPLVEKMVDNIFRCVKYCLLYFYSQDVEYRLGCMFFFPFFSHFQHCFFCHHYFSRSDSIN